MANFMLESFNRLLGGQKNLSPSAMEWEIKMGRRITQGRLRQKEEKTPGVRSILKRESENLGG